MREMFRVISEKLKQGSSLVMVTIVASSGATPRGAGAHMLVGTEGRICGTIGGGAVEDRAIQMAHQVLTDGNSKEQNFSLTPKDEHNLGMICGGEVHVFFSYLSCEDTQLLTLTEQAETYFSEGRDIWLICDLANGGRYGLYTKAGAHGINVPEWLPGRIRRRPERIVENGCDYFVEQIHSSAKVYIFGGGHVAQELVPVLTHVGFRCVVLEDRPEFADPALFPGVEEVKMVDFYQIDQTIQIQEEDYICVMTRGHAYDTVIQAQMLRTPACYIGVIGSRHKKAGVFKILYEQGFTTEDTDRIVTPIGLPIRGETPAEIAISIAAQMIQHRAERRAL